MSKWIRGEIFELCEVLDEIADKLLITVLDRI
jgi:hypothetical protein